MECLLNVGECLPVYCMAKNDRRSNFDDFVGADDADFDYSNDFVPMCYRNSLVDDVNDGAHSEHRDDDAHDAGVALGNCAIHVSVMIPDIAAAVQILKHNLSTLP